jgi:hypothetical protein
MILPDYKRGNRRAPNNTLQGLLAVAENFPHPYIFAVLGFLLFIFVLAIFIFHLLLPERIKYSLPGQFYEKNL